MLVVALPVLKALGALTIAALAQLEVVSSHALDIASAAINFCLVYPVMSSGSGAGTTAASGGGGGAGGAAGGAVEQPQAPVQGTGKRACPLEGCSMPAVGGAASAGARVRHDNTQEARQPRAAPVIQARSSHSVELEALEALLRRRQHVGDSEGSRNEGEGIAPNTTDTVPSGGPQPERSKSSLGKKDSRSWAAAFARVSRAIEYTSV